MAADQTRPANPFLDAWLGAAATPMVAFAKLAEQWQGAFAAAEPSAGEGSEQLGSATPYDFLQALAGDPKAIARMTGQAQQLMRAMTPGPATAPAPAPASVESVYAEFREQLARSPLVAALDWWTAGTTGFERFAQPWTELMQRAMGIAATMGGPSGAGDPMGEALERSFGVLANLPGVNSELPELVREGSHIWSALMRARESYRVIMTGAWQRAFEQIMRELIARAADGKPVDSPAAFLALSNSVADRVFVATFNSERYIAAQQGLSSALADQRRHEMKLVDLFAQFGHFPTRRDIDALTREIASLKRDVRALQRAARATKAPTSRPRSAVASRNGRADAQ